VKPLNGAITGFFSSIVDEGTIALGDQKNTFNIPGGAFREVILQIGY
jgi:hypothetical protein